MVSLKVVALRALSRYSVPYVPVWLLKPQPVVVTEPTLAPVMQWDATWLPRRKAVLARPDALLAAAPKAVTLAACGVSTAEPAYRKGLLASRKICAGSA